MRGSLLEWVPEILGCNLHGTLLGEEEVLQPFLQNMLFQTKLFPVKVEKYQLFFLFQSPGWVLVALLCDQPQVGLVHCAQMQILDHLMSRRENVGILLIFALFFSLSVKQFLEFVKLFFHQFLTVRDRLRPNHILHLSLAHIY